MDDAGAINIGPQQRRRRMRFGAAMLVVGIGAAVALVVGGAARPWRLALLVPFALAGYGVFQARAKT